MLQSHVPRGSADLVVAEHVNRALEAKHLQVLQYGTSSALSVLLRKSLLLEVRHQDGVHHLSLGWVAVHRNGGLAVAPAAQ